MSDQEKKNLEQGLDKLENVEIEELVEEDLESVSGGAETISGKEVLEDDCNSIWCCSNSSD